VFKNVAASFIVFAFDATTNVPKTGDAANITAYVAKDYGTVTVLADTSATEMDATNAPGYYLFAAAQGETNGDCLLVSAKSATANIKVLGAPAVIYTRPTTGWLAPTVAGRTLDVSAGGEAGIDWANVGSPTTSLALTGTTIAVTQKVDVDTIKTNPVVNAGTITFPTTATLASTTNITAGTITTVGTLTTYTGNTPQTGDSFARIGAAGASLTSVALTATQAFNNTGTWTGSLTGSVGSVTGAVGSVTAAVTLTAGERNSVADALLARNIAGGSSAGRIVTDALRFLRNKWSISGTTLTVCAEDDTATAWTATITTDAAALPITANDPS